MTDHHPEDVLQSRFAPVLATLEAERRVIVDRNYTILCISAGITAAGGLFGYDLNLPPLLIGAAVLGIVNYMIFANKGVVQWRLKYKHQVIDTIVNSFFGADGAYQPNKGHPESDFLATQLFDRNPDRFHSEDLITGKVDKTLIAFSEVHAEYKTTNSKGQTTWHTLFKGMIFSADFNKHFSGRTIVKQNSFWRFLKFGNTELENPDFNAEFSVLADDPIEARYILTPALMEKILQINRNWGGSLGLSFIHSQLHIAIPLRSNFFEASVWTKIDRSQQWQQDWQIIAEMVSIVDDLDLNTRIWSKE